MRIIHSAALLIGGLAAGVVITNMAHSEPAQPKSIPVIEVQAPDVAPATYLGESDPIVPLVCGVNLDCSQVDRQIAAQKTPKTLKPQSAAKSAAPTTTTDTTTKSVRTSTSKTGARSKTVTTTHTTKH